MALKTFTQTVGLGTTSGTYGSSASLKLTVLENSTDISTNSSNVTATLEFIIDRYNWRAYSASWSVSGYKTASDSLTSMQYYSGTTTLWSSTFDVDHDSAGNATISFGFGFESSNVYNGSSSLSCTLTTIPRQANLQNAPNFNDEGNPTITYSNPAGNSVNSLQARIESSNGSTAYAAYRDVGKTSSSYTFNLTSSERTALRRAATTNELTVRFALKTVIGGTTYYSRLTKKMTIVNGEPTFSNFTFEDVNTKTVTLTGNSQYNVNGYSTINAIISTTNKATANKEASMSKYRFVIGDKSVDITYSSDDDVEGSIENAPNGTYDIYAIDSRNNSKLVTKLAEKVIPYENIYINKTASSVVRDKNQVGENATLTIKGTFWNDNFGTTVNSIKSITYKFKKTTSSTWIDGETEITPVISGNQFSFIGLLASDNDDTTWDLEDSYNLQVIVEDELSIATIDLILNSAIPTLSMDKNGVGIMCEYDSSKGGKLQVSGEPVYGIALVTGTITTPAADASATNGVCHLAYPAGFNNTNCTILTVVARNMSIEEERWSTISAIDNSFAYQYTSYNLVALLTKDDIVVRIHKVNTGVPSQTSTVRVVLMKIA